MPFHAGINCLFITSLVQQQQQTSCQVSRVHFLYELNRLPLWQIIAIPVSRRPDPRHAAHRVRPIPQSVSDHSLKMRPAGAPPRAPVCGKAMHAVRLPAGQNHYILKLYEQFSFVLNASESFQITGLPSPEVAIRVALILTSVDLLIEFMRS